MFIVEKLEDIVNNFYPQKKDKEKKTHNLHSQIF